MSSPQLLVTKPIPPAVLQMDFTSLDSSFEPVVASDPEDDRQMLLKIMLYSWLFLDLSEQDPPNTSETEAEIDGWLAVRMKKLTKSITKPVRRNATETLRFDPQHGSERLKGRLKKRLLVLAENNSRSGQRKLLDWMMGDLMTWDEVQVSPYSFRWVCALNEIDPKQLSERLLDLCARYSNVPKYARMHLAARRWLDWLPRPGCARQEKLQRLRRLFTPLATQEGLLGVPLLPGPEREFLLRQFEETCAEYGADQELTRRLLWYHCMRWHIAPFNASERLAMAS